MKTSLRWVLATAGRPERRRLLQAGFAAALAAAASVLLLGLSGWFITGAALAGSAGAAVASAFNPLLPSACIRLLAMTRTASRYAERLRGHDAALGILARLRPALYRALADGPVARAVSLPIGDLTSRLVQDVDQIEAAIVRRSAAWGATGATLAGLALLSIAGLPVVGVGVALLGALLLFGRVTARRAARHGQAVPAAQGRLKQDFVELIAAAAEIRAYGLEDWATARIAKAGDRLAAAQRPGTQDLARLELLLGVVFGGAPMMALATAHASPLPVAALVTLGAAMMVDGVAGYLRGTQTRGHLAAAEARIAEILEPSAAREARSEPIPPQLSVEPSTIELPDLGVMLVPGSIVGLHGPSGCGKTSLLEALVGLREPQSVRIVVGGHEIGLLDPVLLRESFALAPQDAALLAGTVRDNLRLGDAGATEEVMWQVLADATLDQRIRALPAGLDSWLGENGERLSTGERRRLSLARAYLRRTPWLLLDEPTEGLDARTEERVVERLHARLRRTGQGAVVVSHHPRPLRACDRVIEMAGPYIKTAPSHAG